jgi:hypothetical protein
VTRNADTATRSDQQEPDGPARVRHGNWHVEVLAALEAIGDNDSIASMPEEPQRTTG